MKCRKQQTCFETRVLATALVVSMFGMFFSACSTFRRNADISYETVAGSPGQDTDLAMREHDKALKIINGDGKHKLSEADLGKAEKHLQRALTADANFGPAHNTLGMIYFMQKKWYLAAWEYQHASKLMPERAEPLSNLGLVYENAMNLEQAIAYYELGYELEPLNPQIIGNLTRALVRSGESSDRTHSLLQDLVMYDDRCDWVAWAKEKLAMSPAYSSYEAGDTAHEDSGNADDTSENRAEERLSDSAERIPLSLDNREELPIPNEFSLPSESELDLIAPVIQAPPLKD